MARLTARFHQDKGQSSLEYLLVVALTFVIIIPATYLFFAYSRDSSAEISDSQIIKLGRVLVDRAEIIFYSGQGSKTVLELNVPENIEGVSIIDGREIVFNISTNFGFSEVVFFSSVNLTSKESECSQNVCRLDELATAGFRKLKVEAITPNSVKVEVV